MNDFALYLKAWFDNFGNESPFLLIFGLDLLVDSHLIFVKFSLLRRRELHYFVFFENREVESRCQMEAFFDIGLS